MPFSIFLHLVLIAALRSEFLFWWPFSWLSEFGQLWKKQAERIELSTCSHLDFASLLLPSHGWNLAKTRVLRNKAQWKSNKNNVSIPYNSKQDVYCYHFDEMKFMMFQNTKFSKFWASRCLCHAAIGSLHKRDRWGMVCKEDLIFAFELSPPHALKLIAAQRRLYFLFLKRQ